MRRQFPVYLLGFAVLAAGVLRAADREIRQVFPVGPNAALLIDTNQGEILVEESDRDEISVSIAIDAIAENDGAAERLLKNVQVAMDSRDNRVSIVVRNSSESGIRFIWNEDERADVIFRVTVPRRCDVEVKAIYAQVTIGSLIGRMKVRVENGSVFLRRIEGSVDALVDFGDLILSRCSGAVNAKILRGHMRLGPIGGRAELNNATGNIEVMVVRHSLEARAQVGDIRVGFAPGLAADSSVRVSGGSIVADFAPATACDLDATATFGRVTSKLPLVIEPGGEGERSLRGRLNGGGPRVELRASGGSVTLGSNPTLLD
jgi:hypothetical protein